jgi:hypothetical protein
MFQRIVAGASCALFALASMPVHALTPDRDAELRLDSNQHVHGHAQDRPQFRIVSPKRGSVTSLDSVAIEIQVGAQMKRESLTLDLNGKNITSQLSAASCVDERCTVTATANKQDGLQEGTNILRASVAGKKQGLADVRTSRFYHVSDLLGDSSSPVVVRETPESVGFRTTANGGGGNTWVSITTGYAAGIDDPVQNYPVLPDSTDPNNPSGPSYTMVPTQDQQFPINCPAHHYQAFVLKRSDPTIQETATCQNDETNVELDFQNKMGRALDDTDLVVFGTTPNQTALTGLDTSSLGGTDFTKVDASKYPQRYVIVGVKGATPGTAHESYNVAGDPQTANFPQLTGTMLQDLNGNYNFVPDNETDFTVISGTNASVQIMPNGILSSSYTPPANASGKFWLMVFDRTVLNPDNSYNTGTFTACTSGTASQSCGMLFDATNVKGIESLATTLNSISPRDLIVLTTVGCPFQAPTYSTDLGVALQNIGGMIHSTGYMNSASNGCNYALVSVNDGKHVSMGSNAALSWSYFSSQKQLGAIHGTLAYDNNGLYDIAGKDQMLMKKDLAGNNVLLPAVDYTFGHLASHSRSDWPITTTTGYLAAYHDISYQLLTDGNVHQKGSRLYDLRYYYTDQDGVVPNLNGLIDSRLGPSATNPVTQSSWDTATGDEFSSVRKQIMTEIQYADSAEGYLTGFNGNGGFRGLLNGTTDTALSDASAIADAIGKDAADATSQVVNSNASDQMNLVAGILSMASLIFKAVPDGEVFSSALGALSGAMRIGSAALKPLADSTDQVGIPGPGTLYDMRLADLTSSATEYYNALLTKYDASSDAILNDWVKLNDAGVLAETPNSGWSVSSLENEDILSTTLQAGQRMSLWTQILGSVYGIRVATNQTTNDPNQLGTWSPTGGDYPTYVCDALFTKVPSTGYTLYPDPGNPSKWDINVIAEGPTFNPNQNNDYPMSSALSTMLTTSQTVDTLEPLEQTGLNIPPMMLIANGPMTFTDYASFNGSLGACLKGQWQ